MHITVTNDGHVFVDEATVRLVLSYAPELRGQVVTAQAVAEAAIRHGLVAPEDRERLRAALEGVDRLDEDLAVQVVVRVARKETVQVPAWRRARLDVDQDARTEVHVRVFRLDV